MKRFLAVFLCVLTFAFTLAACGSSGEAADESKLSNRFRIVDTDTIDGIQYICGERKAYIVVDRETKVCYLYGPGTHATFITVLLDADGKPLIWEGD